MEIPNLSFVLGFRQASNTILANEPFTEPEPYNLVLEDLRRIGPNLIIEGSELRIECPTNGQPRITRGSFRFVDGDRLQQETWRHIMLKLAELGAEYLKKSIAFLDLLPIERAVEDYLANCAFPRPEHVEINRATIWSANDEGMPVIQHSLEMQGLDVKLCLPNLNFLPFPQTATELMQETAQSMIEDRADEMLEELSETNKPQ